MENAWVDDSHHARFLRALKRRRADNLLRSPAQLQELRHDWNALMSTSKFFQQVFEERGIDFPEFVIRNTSALPRSQKPLKAPLVLPVFDFGPLPASSHTVWSAWCPIQAAMGKHGLFLPTDLFELLGSFMAEPTPAVEHEYNCELEDEWSLPCCPVKLV